MKKHLSIAAIGAAALFASGCTLRAEPVQPTLSVSAGYTPLTYEGYAVYYDSGAPYYVVSGRRHYIPRTSRHYHRYEQHYRSHRDRDGYREWRRDRDRRSQGPRYRNPQRRHRPR